MQTGKDVLTAAMFLTRLPLPMTVRGTDVGRAARWFPLVGGAIGAAGALAAWTLRDVGGVPPLASATVVIILGAWVTGAIHLDGLADLADGLGGRSREDALRIMRDPAIGSFGAIALVLVLAMKVTALAALIERDAALRFLVAAPALSRWTIVALSQWLPYARDTDGLGRSVASARSRTGLLAATAIAGAIASVALRRDALVASAAAVLSAALLGRLVRRRIGGITGDVFGASVEIAETAVLMSGVLVTGRG